MEKKSKSDFLHKLSSLTLAGKIPKKYSHILKGFYENYQKELPPTQQEELNSLFLTFLDLIEKEVDHPFSFAPYHERVRSPIDYYTFGLNFLRPLIDKEHCKLEGLDNLKEMDRKLKKKENVILLANHQSEVDPQAISLLLEKSYPDLGEKMIFVAGERVLTDLLAIPFSMGRNLLCIYSKKYIDYPPELKRDKQLHNQKTMEKMSQLLKEGGKAIYVAPSGGRDRPNKEGLVEVAPFDPHSVEMFYLMARKAKTPTSFYPLTLVTYDIMPPPDVVQKELGEERKTCFTPIYASFGEKIDMENFPGKEEKEKGLRRKKRSAFIHNLIQKEYNRLMETP